VLKWTIKLKILIHFYEISNRLVDRSAELNPLYGQMLDEVILKLNLSKKINRLKLLG